MQDCSLHVSWGQQQLALSQLQRVTLNYHQSNCTCDGARQGRLAHARRPDEAQDGGPCIPAAAEEGSQRK